MSSSIEGRLPQRLFSVKGGCLSKVVFCQRLSSVKGLLPSKVVFRQRSSSVKDLLMSNVVFHQMSSSRSSSIKGCFLSKIVFRQRSSSIEGRLPSKVVFHWRSSSSFGSFLFLGFSPECGIAQLSLSLFVFEWVYLNDLHICISRLCIKMSSFLYMCTHAQCRVNFIHHVEFYFRFQHLITLPVYSQLWHSSQGE